MPPMRSPSASERVDGLFRLAGSRSGAFDQVLEEADGDVGQQQAADGLVDAAVLAQPAGQRDPRRAGHGAGDAQRPRVPTTFAGSGSAYGSAAQASPPSTSAPSPPMITSPARAGIATHSAVSISGAARCSVFCHENQSPKAPLNSMHPDLHRAHAGEPDEHAEQQQRRRDGEHGSDSAGVRMILPVTARCASADGCGADAMRAHECRVRPSPTTPSTR